MRAGDVMTRQVITIERDAPVGRAIRLLLQHRISGLPVVDADGTLEGIVTEGDFLHRAETGTQRRRRRGHRRSREAAGRRVSGSGLPP